MDNNTNNNKEATRHTYDYQFLTPDVAHLKELSAQLVDDNLKKFHDSYGSLLCLLDIIVDQKALQTLL